MAGGIEFPDQGPYPGLLPWAHSLGQWATRKVAPCLFMTKEYSIAWTKPHLSASAGRRLCCFPLGLFWIMLWTRVYRIWLVHVFKFLGAIPTRLESLGHVVIVCLTPWGPARPFSNGPPLFTVRSAAWDDCSPSTPPAAVVTVLWLVILPSRCKAVAQGGFDLHFPFD